MPYLSGGGLGEPDADATENGHPVGHSSELEGAMSSDDGDRRDAGGFSILPGGSSDAENDAQNDESAPRSDRRRRRRRVLPIVIAGLALLLVGSIIAAATYLNRVDAALNDNLQRSSYLPEDAADGATPGMTAAPRPQRQPNSDALNFVLIGSDSESGGGGARSDALMVLHLTSDRKAAYLISFPRDMYVAIPGHGKNKINAAYAFGGVPLTIRTLEGLLDTRIDHAATIDFDGFVSLTEELGGVMVYNPHPSVSGGWTFPKGYVTVHGERALAYVRERKQLPRGDLDRAARQRAVTQAIIEKGLSAEYVANPSKFLRFAGQLASHVTVDEQLTKKELRSIFVSLRLTPNDLHQLQAPISRFDTSKSGQSIDVVDTEALAELGKALRDDTMQQYVADHPER